jgi:hypothetical protein
MSGEPITIHPPGSGRFPWAAVLGGIAAIIVAIGGLVTALGQVFPPRVNVEQQIAPLTSAVHELVEGQRRTGEWMRRHEGTHDMLLERDKARRNEVDGELGRHQQQIDRTAERVDWVERLRR